MATNLETLEALLIAKAQEIVDPIDQVEALCLITSYIALKTAIEGLSSGTMSSYSIAGRSVTNSDLSSLLVNLRAVRGELANYLPPTAAETIARMPSIGDISQMEY